MTETALQRAIVDSLRLTYGRNMDLMRTQSGRVRKGRSWIYLCPEGTPDLCGCLHGRFFALEVKLPGEDPTPVQLERHAELRRAGAVVTVVHSVTEAVAALSQLHKDILTEARCLEMARAIVEDGVPPTETG